MDAALGWLGAVVEWFGQFLPRWKVVPPTHGWVKFRKGNEITSGGAGIVWWWPAITVFHDHPIARQALDLRPQVVTTKDQQTVLVGGLITYRIYNIEKAMAETWNLDEAVRDLSLSTIHSAIGGQLTWEEIQKGEQDGTLKKRLTREARRQLEPYGVRVIKLSLTDLAKTRVVKLAMSTDTIV